MAGPRQRKRTPKTSNGSARGSKRVQLTGIQKILLGGGLHRNINKPNFGKKKKSHV